MIEDELLILRKGPLEVIFVRLPFGPDKITATLDLKKLIIKSNNAELRYVNNESPYTKATPCFSYWGGDKTLKSYTDTLAIALYNIAYKMSEA